MHIGARNTITIFLSSPGDVGEERRTVTATIRNLNEEILCKLGLHIELISSDTMLPDAGHPQIVINRQIPKYDLFIGIMWARFGTPTERAGSGTEEELREALERRIKNGDGCPRILLYFCDRPVSFPKTTEEVHQLEQVVAFRDECKSQSLFSVFDDIRTFEQLVRRHLTQFALERWQTSITSTEQEPPRIRSSINDAVDRLETKFKRLFWVGYAPVDLNPDAGRYPQEKSIKADLQILSHGPFGGIITFGSEQTLARIPDIARTVGINGVIMGIYDPCNAAELQAAIDTKESVDGYCVGHLGLRDGRYDQVKLEEAIRIIRESTGKPVSTTEALEDFVAYEGVSDSVDWLFPDMHQYWHEGTNPDIALSDLVRMRDTVRKLREHLGVHRPLLMKMLSYPSSGGPGLTQENQYEFFMRVLRTLHNDVSGPGRLYPSFFSAFDNDWKKLDSGWSAAELSTGLYDLTRAPKLAVDAFRNTRRKS